MFLGAPTKCLVWVPVPEHVTEQYLLVSYRKSMDKYTRYSNYNSHSTLILLFKVTICQHVPQISLMYGIRMPNAPVHAMALMPNGGYDENKNRLGLLAVGSNCNSIGIYALPLSVDAEFMENEFPILYLNPCMNLVLNAQKSNEFLPQTEDKHTFENIQTMAICWSEVNNLLSAYKLKILKFIPFYRWLHINIYLPAFQMVALAYGTLVYLMWKI